MGTGMQAQEQELLFRQICTCRSKWGESLRVSGGIRYTCLREQFKRKPRQLGYNAKEFVLHSLWAGVTAVAANAGVPDHIFKRYGRLKPESARMTMWRSHCRAG